MSSNGYSPEINVDPFFHFPTLNPDPNYTTTMDDFDKIFLPSSAGYTPYFMSCTRLSLGYTDFQMFMELKRALSKVPSEALRLSGNVASRAGKNPISSLASGLLTVGSCSRGALVEAVYMFLQARDMGLTTPSQLHIGV
jgi:hypothetical protein